MPRYISIFLLFFLPLIILPVSNIPAFEVPKVIFAEACIWALFLSFPKDKENLIRNIKSSHAILFLLVVLLTIFDLIFFRTRVSFLGNSFRFQGIFLLWQLLLFAYLSSKINITKIKSIPFIALISLILISIGAIIFGPNQSLRLVGTLGEPNALAAAAIFIWPFALLFKKKPLTYLSIFIGSLIIFVSGSRSGILAFGLELIFLGLITKLHMSMLKALLFCVFILVLSYTFPLIEKGGWFENRSEIWQTAFESGKSNPIFGHGFGNVEIALKDTSKKLNNNVQYQYIDSSHNIFLDWWVEGGIVGIVLLVLILGNTARNLINKNMKLELTILIGLVAVLSFNPASIATLIAFWWTLGQGFDILATCVTMN